jgi:20S proteasome alpha/beta subunit
MTCIVGMFFDSKAGALVLSDSRIMRGGDYARDQKIFVVGDEVVFAAAGYSGIAKKLLHQVEATRIRSRKYLRSEVVEVFEDEMAELHNRYKVSRPYRFSDSDNLLQGIIGFVDDKKPQLYCLYENGYAEAIPDFLAIGHGARHAHNILRSLYSSTIPRDRALELAVHVLVEVAKADAMVDDAPQVVVLGEKVGPNGIDVLNNEGGKFKIADCSRVEPIKKKVEGIEQKMTDLFHRLLDTHADATNGHPPMPVAVKPKEVTDAGKGSRGKGPTAS